MKTRKITYYFAPSTLWLIVAWLMFLPVILSAQPTPEFAKNTGPTVNNTLTWGGGTSHKKSQQLYRSSDFSPAVVPGKIHKLYFMYGSTGITAPTTYTNLFVKLGQTTDTEFQNTNFYTGLTTVLSAASYTLSGGTEGTWFEIPLQVPFDYDPSQTLIVEIRYDTLVNSDNSTGFGTFNGTSNPGRKLNHRDVNSPTGNAQASFPNFGVQIISQVGKNAAVSKLVGPINYCAGNHPVQVELKNNGITAISSLSLDWELDGVAQPRVNYNTLLDTLGSVGGNRATVTLGNVSLTDNAHVIRAWIHEVEGQPDMMHADDTLEVTIQSSMQGVFTINKNAPSSASNFQSFGELSAALNSRGVCDNVIVNVVPNSGPYFDSIVFDNIVGTTASKSIRINGNGNTIQQSSRPMALLSRVSHVRIDSLIFKSVSVSNVSMVAIMKESHHDSITNCVFDLGTVDNSVSGNYAIAITNSITSPTSAGKNGSHCYLAGNRITCDGNKAGAAYGIAIAGASDSNMVVNNLIENVYNVGILLGGGNGNVIEGNRIHRAQKIERVTTFYGISTTGNIPGAKIIGNRVHDPVGVNYTGSISSACNGLRLTGSGTSTDPVIVANNIIYNMNWGGEAYGIFLSAATENKIYHNTVVFDKAVGSSKDQSGFYATGNNLGSEFKNNIISFTQGGTSGKYGFYYNGSSDTSMPNPANNVIYVNSTQSGGQFYGYYNGKAFPNRTSFLNAYPALEAFSLDSDPQFVNPAGGDYSPGNRALQGVGQDLTAEVPIDITGVSRAQAPTPGSYEIVVPSGANARVAAIVTPVGYFCHGNQDVRVAIQNAGTTNISSMQVQWSLDGVLQTPVTFNGSLTAAGTAGSIDTISLGVVNMPSGATILKAWTVLAGDVNPENDTLTETLLTSLSGTYTVNSANPTSGNNFRSFADLSEALYFQGVCGPVTVDVTPGTYNGAVTFYDHPGGGSSNPVLIKGNGSMIQYATGTATGLIRQLVTLSGTKNMRIDSMVFRITSGSGWGTWITGGAQYDSITNCRYDLTLLTATSSANGTGIAFSSSESNATGSGISGTHCYIGNNHIQGPVSSGGPYYGVSMGAGGNDSNIVVNNIIENVYNTGVYLSATVGTVVKGNEIHRKDKRVGSTFYGIHVLGTSPGVHIVGNKIYSPLSDTVTAINFAFRGINTSGTPTGTAQHPVLIANNIVYNIRMGGTSTIHGVYLDVAKFFKVYHNTVSINSSYSGTGANYGIYATGSLSDVDIKNNLVSITGGGAGAKYGFYYASAATLSGIDAQRNNYYVNSTQGGAQYYGFAATAFSTQADFHNVHPTRETGSLTVDPQFANLATGYLMPTNQALQGNGVNILSFVAEDFEGTARSSVPTPGAYEIPASAGYNAGVDALISPNRVFCAGRQEIKVVVQNAGSFPISNMTLQWTFNGVAQPPYNYTGILDIPGGANGNTDTITLGTVTVPSGLNTIKAWTLVAGDVNPANDTLEVPIEPSDFTLYVAPDTVCTGGATYLRIEPSSGYESGMLQWQSSSNGATFSSISGADSQTYETMPLTAATWYRVFVTSGLDGCYSDTAVVRVVDPVLSSISGAERCGTGSVTISANASTGSVVKWYSSLTADSAIAIGSDYTTPSLSTNATYYAAAALGNGGVMTVGPQNPAALYGVGTNGLPNWIVYFTVHEHTVLESVDIFPDAQSVGKSSALRIINTATNNVVALTPYTVEKAATTTAGQTVKIHQKLAPGNYSIGMADNTVTLMINRDSAVYPYDSRALSITGHNFSAADYYWFFYNWKVGYGCESARQAVNVIVTPAPSVTIAASNSTVCAGDTLQLTASSSNNGYTYSWRPGNLVGSTISVSPATTTTYYLDALDKSNGPNKGCVLEDSITVTVHSAPNAQITAGGATSICEGTSVSLIANTGIGYAYQWYRDNNLIGGALSSTYQANLAGSYQVRVTGSNSCGSLSSPVVVSVNPNPQPVITRNGDLLTTGSYAQYQWRRNGAAIQGAINQSISPVQAGSYTVVVTDANGCVGESAPFDFQPSEMVHDGVLAERTFFYPNPVNDILYVRSAVPVHVSISSPDGKLVRYVENVQEVQMGDIVPGVYFVRIYGINGTLIKMGKLLKSDK